MTGGGFNTTEGQKKLRGCIAASPIVPFGFVLTSSSLLSFSLPFYSPPTFLKFTPALLAERVFNLMYRYTDLSCQEESEVIDEKNEIAISESEKRLHRPPVCSRWVESSAGRLSV
jgi:hypothetical protein